jgi:cyclopropane fatty-acyl-phospholipid synthase-like methyltransferase
LGELASFQRPDREDTWQIQLRHDPLNISACWIAHRERHLAEHQHLIPHLFGVAPISPGERVLDVGCGCGATAIVAR